MRVMNVLGEAAAQTSVPTREACPKLPWSEMIGMRNRLIHACHDVNLSIVWRTVREDLPELCGELWTILNEIDEASD
jgi:uncharacterized protein with HEPN domain